MADSLKINGTRTALDILRSDIERPRPPRPGPVPPAVPPAATPPAVARPLGAAATRADYIKLENIVCKDADGHEFERYDVLYVRKDIERKVDNSQKSFTTYQGAVYLESQGLFLPSMALSCAIVAQLYQRKNEPDVHAVLMQYKDQGNQTGWHAQNTVINYKAGKIIHYPSDADFPANGGANGINQAPCERKELSFVKSQTRSRRLRGPVTDSLGNCKLEDGLKNSVVARFTRQLTGLEDPSVLVEVGKYFQKPAYVWFPSNVQQSEETKGAWLGCGEGYFNLNANDNLGITVAARGVRLGAP